MLADGNSARFVWNRDESFRFVGEELINCPFDAIPIQAHLVVYYESARVWDKRTPDLHTSGRKGRSRDALGHIDSSPIYS